MTGTPAFVINLDRDVSRWEHMQAEAAKIGLGVERFAAVDGRRLPAEFEAPLGTAETRRKLKPGEIGCYASHLALMRLLAYGGIGDALLVLEDDLLLSDDLTDLLDDLGDVLPPEWDIVRLSNPPKRAYLPLGRLGGRELVKYSKIPNNTGAYLISRHGARKFLAATGPRIRAVDEDLRRPWIFGLDTYGIVPAPVTSNIFDSSIDAMEDRGLRPAPVKFAMPKENLAGVIKRLVYNITDLGGLGWLRCAAVNATRHLRRRKGPKHDARTLRVSTPERSLDLARARRGS